MRERNENWIEILVKKAYEVDSNIYRRIRGSSEKEIREFESVSSEEFPSNYKEFLLCCGRNDGGLMGDFPAFTCISDILSTYEEFDEFPDEHPPKGWFLIAIGYAGTSLIMNSKSGEIYSSSFGDVDKYFASSITELVGSKMYSKYFDVKSELPW